MRDLERWKDKVELSLDGRQIFFLFFGSAALACLIFVAGVLIGKRLEARALAMTPPPVEDPLAALDQLGDSDQTDDGLTFHRTLTQPAAPEAHAASAKSVAPALPVPAPQPAVAKAKSAVKPELAKAPLPAGKPEVVTVAKKGDAKEAAKKPEGAPHFTLQLSAFPEKADAEAFMQKIAAAGYHPFLVASEIPGRGLFYRVRVGDFGSRQAALTAKNDFEHKQRLIAYVAKL